MDAATVAILVALIGGPAGGVVLSHFFQPKKSLPERLEQLENDFRILQDYTHTLREHIADGKAPPPPPWPEGLTQ